MDRASLIYSLSLIHEGLAREADAVSEVEQRVRRQEARPEDLARIAGACRYGLLQHQNAVCALLAYLERLPDGCDDPHR